MDALLSRYPDRRDRVTFVYSWAIRSRVRRINNTVRCASTSWVCMHLPFSDGSVMQYPDLPGRLGSRLAIGWNIPTPTAGLNESPLFGFLSLQRFPDRSALTKAASSSSHPASTFYNRPCGFGAPCQARRPIASYAFMALRVTSSAIGLSLDSVPLRTCCDQSWSISGIAPSLLGVNR